MQMMQEMRKAHIQEVRLLQRGLQARSGDEKMRNRVNEVADLVDKLGRAVLQRDEVVRDKTKIQVKLTKAENDLRAVTNDFAKLQKQNRQLESQLKEALRKARFHIPRPDVDIVDDSDEEFEHELSAFEKRFEILEEGPAGLDILASNLAKDKQILERRLKKAMEELKKKADEAGSWKKRCEEKEVERKELLRQKDEMMQQQARDMEAVESKKREIELQVQEEIEQMKQLAEGHQGTSESRVQALASAYNLSDSPPA